eukprot:366228-Chlamydomonas_euryale.AAC.18
MGGFSKVCSHIHAISGWVHSRSLTCDRTLTCAAPPPPMHAQDPTPDTCVTVCGTSGRQTGWMNMPHMRLHGAVLGTLTYCEFADRCVENVVWQPRVFSDCLYTEVTSALPVCIRAAVDACTEACLQTVCVNRHHVPAWNENCLKRCKAECLKGRSIKPQ